MANNNRKKGKMNYHMKKLFLSLLTLSLLLSCGNKNKAENEITINNAHPEWVYNAVIYEVNIRQFTPEGTFSAFSGQLQRLKELGADILWFMPVQSIGEKDRKGTLGSYYSVRDYTQINSEFGTFDDFKSVVRQAQEKGMKVILDWVANHTSRDAVWVEANPGWYLRDSLGDLSIMYDWTDIAQLDYSQHEMRKAMIEAMMFWVRETGIDGFRCDVAGEVPTGFWEEAKDSLLSLNPDIFLLAEAEKPELNETVFDAYYAWDFHHKMNMVAQGKENADSLRLSLLRMNNRFSPDAVPMFFTSNHDENSWNGTEFERMGDDAAETFAVLTYMLPGMPLIYSGQEVGLNRRLQFFEKDSIDWADTGGFTSFYKRLNAFKKDNNALMAPEHDGEMLEITNDCPIHVWSFRRVNNGNEVVCVFNFSNKSVTVKFNEKIPGEGFSSFPDACQAVSVDEMELVPWGYRIYSK